MDHPFALEEPPNAGVNADRPMGGLHELKALGEQTWTIPPAPPTATEGEAKPGSMLGELGIELIRRQDLKAKEISEMLLKALSKQQLEHERRIEALLSKQDMSIVACGIGSTVVAAQNDKKDEQAGLVSGSVPMKSEEIKDEDVVSVPSVPSSAGGATESTALRSAKSGLVGKRMSEYQKPTVKRISEQIRAMNLIRKDVADSGKTDITRKSLFSKAGTDGKLAWARQVCVAIVKDRHFESSVCAVILINAILIGIEADLEMKEPLTKPWPGFRVLNVLFTVVFAIELILRVIVEGRTFFWMINPKLGWNIFDSLIVVSALFEEVLQLVLSSSPDMSSMRILRTMRVVRGFRIVRVFAFFRDLRVMVAGITQSFSSLIWAMLLLLSIMYLFSVVVLQFCAAEHIAQMENSTVSLDAEMYAEMLKYYRDLGTTIYTLYVSIIGGMDWADACEPLLQLHTILALLYCGYVAFSVLCVLNIITGVFVENANRTTAQDAEMVMMEQMEHREKWFEEVKELFEQADTDGSGFLDANEFSKQVENLKLQAQFRKLGVLVEPHSAPGLFKLLDFDGNGRLDIDEFATGLQQVHGNARSIDVARISRQSNIIRAELGELSHLCFSFFEELPKLLENRAPQKEYNKSARRSST